MTSCCMAGYQYPLCFGAAGYVEQFDTLLAELMVCEMLLCTALLKCSLAESLD